MLEALKREYSWIERKTNEVIVKIFEDKRAFVLGFLSFIEQLKNNAKINTYKELKEKANNRFKWTIGIVDLHTWVKKKIHLCLHLTL